MHKSVNCEVKALVFIQLLLFEFSAGIAHCASSSIETAASFSEASMSFDDSKLTVRTGKVSRQWKVTSKGLSTIALRRGTKSYCEPSCEANACDWDLGDLGDAQLVSLYAKEADDDGFTTRHLNVVAEFVYPAAHLKVRYVVWAYPDSPGIRTQLQLQGLPGFARSMLHLETQVVETLDFSENWASKRAFGLVQGIKANQIRKILREQVITADSATIDWANGIVLHSDQGGIVLVKESNKHIASSKEDDVATGSLVITGPRFSVTGAGLFPQDIREDRYTTCWATWTVLYGGNEAAGQLALKQFDRLRFPIDHSRDIYIMANTWGTEDLRPPCLHAAREENVLRELESVASLGIDVLQIDDGWQTPAWTPAASASQVQHGNRALQSFGDYSVYPTGWENVREKAQELGVTLGLWASWTAPIDALQKNYDQGDFKYFKLDFARLNTKERVDNLAWKARKLIIHSGNSARVNWDVTEPAARMGYFLGREYGNVYLANRKTKTSRSPVLYVPHKVLNDAWNVSKYVNLNKFQVTVQNVDNVLTGAETDAGDHGHDYAVGIALMSSPIFFQETRHYKPSARSEVRNLLSVYKRHRHAMYNGYVFPIGNEPNNKSWTGFQNHNPARGGGYLTVFRERQNKSTNASLHLNFIAGSTIQLTNLLTDESSQLKVGSDGEVRFTQNLAPGFQFYHYQSIQ